MRLPKVLALCVLLVGVAAAPVVSIAASPMASGRLLIEPQAGAAPYVAAVEQAKHAVDVNSYLLDDSSLVSALIAAAKRGVSVHVIVAGNPYGDASAVSQEKAEFSGTGVQIKTAPARFEGSWVFDHAKYLVVDPGYATGDAILGSSNMDYSGLGGRNREYDWETSSPRVVRALAEVFGADWAGRKAGSAPRSALVLSPGAERAILGLIDSSHHGIEIETEEFSRVPAVALALEAVLRLHESVRIVVPSSISSYDLEQLRPLARDGAKIVEVGSPYIHAKLIIADSRAFIGSQNFSASSLDDNREVGILLDGAPVQALLRQFNTNFAAGKPIR